MRAKLKGQRGRVYNVPFSPNGRFLLSPFDGQSVRILNIRDGSSRILPVTGSPGTFMSVAFSPDGRYAVAGNSDGSLWIWDSRTHRLVAKWQGHIGCVWSTVFTTDGKGLMSGSGSYDKTVKYWDVSLLGNRRGVSWRTVVNEEDGFAEVRRFIGHGVSCFLPLCHNTDRVTFVPQGVVFSIALFPGNAQWLVTGSEDRFVRVWDTENGVCQLMLQGHTYWVRGVDVSHGQTQNFLATAGRDGHVSVWIHKLL